ncbi:hypothetical protein GIB67_025910 [Kingdonia uniflora]|uniref:Uncharacterized protein n=1 Tax=Kingdonia uniflora TaxID=39325 RepID=A0A7J7NYY1_9MAGN|nr:hypothetical protein GIB67_025910 [Kingdonia uniflora]
MTLDRAEQSLALRLCRVLTLAAKCLMVAGSRYNPFSSKTLRNMWEAIAVCSHLNEKWENEGKVRRISPKDVLQLYGVKNYKASGVSYLCMKSKVERKESLLDEVAEEVTKLELVLEGLGLSRKKRVDSRSNKVQKAQSTRGRGKGKVGHSPRRGIYEQDGDMARYRGIKSELKKENAKLEKELARSRTDALMDIRQLKASHAVVIGDSEEEVNVIKADTYAEEEDEEEAEAVGIMDGLDGVPARRCSTITGMTSSSQKAVREMSLRVIDLEFGLARERETSKTLLSIQAELQVKEKDAKINKGLKELAEVTEHAEKLQRRVDALAVKAREELNVEIRRLRAQVVDLEAINLAESVKFIKKLEENVIYHAKVDAEMIEQKNEYASFKSRLEKVRARFATMVIPNASRSDLLKAIIAYFVEEVKRLESERDTLFKILSDKGCICGAKIDRGNCLGVMETQLGPRTAELIELGRITVIREVKVRPLDVGGNTVDFPPAEKKPL